MATKPRDPLARAKADFRVMLYLVWQHLRLPEPTPAQLDMAYYLQHGPRRKLVFAFRGMGKSWVFAAFVCWLLLNDPDKKVMIVSATKPYATAMSRFIKQLIAEMPILQHLQPKDEQRDSVETFDVGPARTSKDPSVKSVGIFGQLAGSRADVILADDIETPVNSATEGMREKLSEAVKEFDAVLKPGGAVTYLGTPQSYLSMYNQLSERGYDLRIWPVRVPADPDKYAGRLAPYIYRLIEQGAKAGAPVDPKRFSDEDLQERARSYGPSGFALQFMLDTALDDSLRFPLRLSDLLILPMDRTLGATALAWSSLPEYTVEGVHTPGLPGDKFFRPMFIGTEMVPYTGSLMTIDPAGTGKDETAYNVTKHLHGRIFLHEAGGLPGGYSEDTLDELVRIAKAHDVNMILVEDNFGDGMFRSLLQSRMKLGGYLCAVEGIKHTKQKELRIIDTLEPVIAQHRLVVNHALINADFETAPEPGKSLFWQLTRITRDKGSLKHDDRLDCLAMAVAYWSEQMAQDSGQEANKLRDKLLEAELKRFRQHVVGGASRFGRAGRASMLRR